MDVREAVKGELTLHTRVSPPEVIRRPSLTITTAVVTGEAAEASRHSTKTPDPTSHNCLSETLSAEGKALQSAPRVHRLNGWGLL